LNPMNLRMLLYVLFLGIAHSAGTMTDAGESMHSDESLNIAFSKAMLKIIERGTRFKNDIDDILRNAVIGAAPKVEIPEHSDRKEWPEFASGHPGAFDAKIRTVLDSHSDRISGVENMLTDAIAKMANISYGPPTKDREETGTIETEPMNVGAAAPKPESTFQPTILLVTETISDVSKVKEFCEALKQKIDEIPGMMNKCEAVPEQKYSRNLQEQEPGQVLLEIEFPDEATADKASDEIFTEGKSFGGVVVMSVDNLEQVAKETTEDLEIEEETTVEPIEEEITAGPTEEEETAAETTEEDTTWAPEDSWGEEPYYAEENGEDEGVNEMAQLGNRHLREGSQHNNPSQPSIRTL